jgi:hypothetical protein
MDYHRKVKLLQEAVEVCRSRLHEGHGSRYPGDAHANESPSEKLCLLVKSTTEYKIALNLLRQLEDIEADIKELPNPSIRMQNLLEKREELRSMLDYFEA